MLCIALGLMLPITSAWAYGFDVGRLTYIYYQHSSTPAFDIARDVMKPTYKDTTKYKNPLIGIAEVDLNNDNMTEIISVPTEEYEEQGWYCKPGNVCPYYITEIRGKKIHSLGIIEAEIVDLGDDTRNGYWRLKAFQKRDDPKTLTLYEYNRAKDAYVLSKP